MKRITLFAAALLTCVSAAFAQGNLKVTFDGTDNAKWTVGQQAENTVTGGHLNVNMAVQSNGKYRADLSFSDNENSYKLNASTDKVLAIKFIGKRPAANMTLEFKNGSAWLNSKWKNNPTGTVMTAGGNNIYYYDLTKDEAYTGELDVNTLNIKIADCAAEPYSYSIDWIATFESVEDLQAKAEWKDDGDNDADEQGVVADPDVKNLTSGAIFASLTDAINGAADGDVIEIYKDQTIGDRLTLEKELTIKGNAKIVRGFKNKLLFIIKKEVSFEGVTFVNAEEHDCSTPLLEISSKCNLKDVKILNVSSTHNQGVLCVKGGGNLKADNLVFEGCKAVDNDGRNSNIFFGFNAHVAFTGDCGTASVFIERETGVVDVEDLTNTQPIALHLADKAIADRTEPVVKGTSDAAKFSLVNAGYHLDADAETNALYLKSGESTGIDSSVAETVKAGNVYNLAGQKVSTYYKGIIIVNGKKMIRK